MDAPIAFAVNGTLMRGLERNGDLVQAGAAFQREAHTAPSYRLWSVDDVHPAMLRVASGGRSIAVEIWLVPSAAIPQILLSEPPGLCVGRLTLDDGSVVLGVLAEPALVEGQREITGHGGWRAYLAAHGPDAKASLPDVDTSRTS
ncbi:MAG: glutamyl-tRNA amidotransferase [Actinobacteria bacterium]|nr:glutamyl-tRNA amidotransferase [Actinomycetota bacterium]